MFTYTVEDEETLATEEETATVADYEEALATLEELGDEPDPRITAYGSPVSLFSSATALRLSAVQTG